MTFPKGLSNAVLVLGVGVILASALLQTRRLRAIELENASLLKETIRGSTRDNLVGRRIPNIDLTTPDGSLLTFLAQGDAELVWIVAPRQCHGCLDDLDVWNRVAAAPNMRTTLILSGINPMEAAILATRLRTAALVAVDTSESLRAQLGISPPSTML